MRTSRSLLLAAGCLAGGIVLHSQAEKLTVTREMVAAAEKLYGLHFTDAQRDQMADGLAEQQGNYQKLREVPLPNSTPPALQFNPVPIGMKVPTGPGYTRFTPVGLVKVPKEPADLAFYSVAELGELLRTRRVTSMQLTKLALERLKQYDPQLHCVITLTEETALEQASAADKEIKAGRYRGPLHGIPYGAKDLLAAKGYKTTWGAGPYREQMIDEDATVIRKLREAGAVLVAKMTLGELAMGDIWFGEKTRNPWNLEQGSSGSSAGSAAATAAGLVPFAIGTETLGSIVSPSTRCGVTGLRPTYGRVSRSGAMALSWSMDKIGPICRNVEDCALVFKAIHGPDGVDQSVSHAPFTYQPVKDLRRLRIGYLKSDFEKAERTKDQNEAALAELRKLGAELIPIELPKYPARDLIFLLVAEGAAAFDEMTRSGRDALLVQQGKNDWANTFRQSRFIPAVEYINAQRVRQQLIQDMYKVMQTVDVYVAPSQAGSNLVITNLTGHPCVVVPTGFLKDGSPTSITFMAGLYEEGKALAVAKAYQDATPWNKQRPPVVGGARPVSAP